MEFHRFNVLADVSQTPKITCSILNVIGEGSHVVQCAYISRVDVMGYGKWRHVDQGVSISGKEELIPVDILGTVRWKQHQLFAAMSRCTAIMIQNSR